MVTKLTSLARKRLNLLLALFAALFYSSWPLGYLLNPFVAHHDLASQLEASQQPYGWLFSTLDVSVGVLLLVVSYRLFRKVSGRLANISILTNALFGCIVAIAALTPPGCDPEASACGPILHNPLVIIHGFASIISVLFLLVSLLSLSIPTILKRASKLQLAALIGTLCLWLIFGIGMMVDLLAHQRPRDLNLVQYSFISVCSLTVFITVYLLEKHQPTPSENLVDIK